MLFLLLPSNGDKKYATKSLLAAAAVAAAGSQMVVLLLLKTLLLLLLDNVESVVACYRLKVMKNMIQSLLSAAAAAGSLMLLE